MKIGIVCYPTYGGSGVVATELGLALAEKGHQVHFITYSFPQRLEHYCANVFYHEVSVANYPLFQYPPYELALASKIVDVAINEGLDVLHVHYAIPHASAAYMAKQILASRGKKLPFITTLHGTDITIVGKDSSYEPVVTFSINESDIVTSVSESLKNDTHRSFKIDKDIKVVPNFINLERFKKQKKEHFKQAICPNGEKLIVHTSNFRPVKRVQDVIKTFYELRKEIPAKLLLVGDGPERAHMEQLCRELGACDDIRFLGKLDVIEEVLSVSDLFMMPSEEESFGLAALEAMACEVPVLSSNAGGIPELNLDGETGFCCNVGDIEDLVSKAKIILAEDNLNKFKSNALKRATEFDVVNILPIYEKLYFSLVKTYVN